MRFILEPQGFWCIQSVAALGAWEETSVWGDQERFACVWKAVVSRHGEGRSRDTARPALEKGAPGHCCGEEGLGQEEAGTEVLVVGEG